MTCEHIESYTGFFDRPCVSQIKTRKTFLSKEQGNIKPTGIKYPWSNVLSGVSPFDCKKLSQ